MGIYCIVIAALVFIVLGMYFGEKLTEYRISQEIDGANVFWLKGKVYEVKMYEPPCSKILEEEQ